MDVSVVAYDQNELTTNIHIKSIHSCLQSCRTIELEHHRSPCRCACLRSAADCAPRQRFDPSKCACHCDQSHNQDKYNCALDPRYRAALVL